MEWVEYRVILEDKIWLPKGSLFCIYLNMKVKVAGRVFDSNNVPIMIMFSDEEKKKYNLSHNEIIVVTPRMNNEEIENFINKD